MLKTRLFESACLHDFLVDPMMMQHVEFLAPFQWSMKFTGGIVEAMRRGSEARADSGGGTTRAGFSFPFLFLRIEILGFLWKEIPSSHSHLQFQFEGYICLRARAS